MFSVGQLLECLWRLVHSVWNQLFSYFSFTIYNISHPTLEVSNALTWQLRFWCEDTFSEYLGHVRLSRSWDWYQGHDSKVAACPQTQFSSRRYCLRVQCRYTLQFTYPYAYYLEKCSRKQLVGISARLGCCYLTMCARDLVVWFVDRLSTCTCSWLQLSKVWQTSR